MSRESGIEAALSYLDPDVAVQATKEPDGCRIVVEAGGQQYRLSVGKGWSALLNYLVTGHAT